MQDHRARARFPRPDVRSPDEWGRSARSLAGDPSFERISRSLWARVPDASGAHPGAPVLSIGERAALLQLHRADEHLLVSHLSAARLWGLPLSDSAMTWSHRLLGEQPLIRELESRPQLSHLGRPRHQGPGAVRLHRGFGLEPVIGLWGAQVASPTETLLGSMPWLPGWRAVAAVDRMLVTGPRLLGPLGQLTPDSLLTEAEALPAGTHGIARLRRAVGSSAPSTWSPMETLLRMLVIRCGLPAPTMNLPVRLPGGIRYVLDLAWREQLTALEYNGRVHYEDRRTYGDEQHRLHVLADAGWKVRTVVVADLKDPHRTAAMLRWLRTHLI